MVMMTKTARESIDDGWGVCTFHKNSYGTRAAGAIGPNGGSGWFISGPGFHCCAYSPKPHLERLPSIASELGH